MDTRFPPLPLKVKVPLYPKAAKLTGINRRNVKVKLSEYIARVLHTTKDQVLFADSASNALYTQLIDYKASNPGADIKVALPAFNCTTLVDAVLSSGCQPVFIEINEKFTLPQNAIDFAITQQCDFLIWPNYFGTRLRDVHLLEKLKQYNLKIIFDEAQSFPIMYEKIHSQVNDYAYAVLFSFGKNKAIAGIGGGAIYMPHKKVSSVQQNHHRWKHRLRSKIALSSEVNKHVLKHSLSKTASILLPKEKKRFLRLDTLLESQSIATYTKHKPISSHQAQRAYRNIVKLSRSHDHLDDYARLNEELSTISPKLLSYLDGILGVPSIVALNIQPDHRYKALELLSENGIQATWYYYPLNRLKRYSTFPSQPGNRTEHIAATIIILPYCWHHSKNQKMFVLKSARLLAERLGS